MPLTKEENGKSDFIDWVDKFLKTEPNESYQYLGKDLYAARCGKLHSFAATSAYANRNKTKIFGYHGGKGHKYNPEVNKDLVIISIPTLIRDFSIAINKFIELIKEDTSLKSRVDSRINSLYSQFDIN
ncbi:MAG: hypothetical protein JSS07_07200 [Proteobacteria bacterium]|nr:hypothetical protein [Pseudomonadota bacterium]